MPFAIDYDGEFAGQLNVSSITYGSLSSATIGYWVSERFAGKNVTPTAVADTPNAVADTPREVRNPARATRGQAARAVRTAVADTAG